jgi:hypothetical protein
MHERTIHNSTVLIQKTKTKMASEKKLGLPSPEKRGELARKTIPHHGGTRRGK